MSLFNELDRITELRPKIKDWKEEEVRYAQEKKNGYRLTLTCDEYNKWHAFGKKENYIDKILHLFQEGIYKDVFLPSCSIVDGEVYVKGKKASDVPTAMNEKWDTLRFAAFAMPYADKSDARNKDLGEINKILKDCGFEVPILYDISSGDYTDEQLLESAKELKIEGWVLKNAHYEQWYKLKVLKSCDVVITKWEPGSGLMTGLMGALVGSVYQDGVLKEITNIGTGFDEEQREKFTPEFCMGKVVEVTYQDVAAKGRLQHARFVRFRDDKEAKDCTISQLE